MKEIAKKVKLSKPFDVDKITIKRDRYFPSAYIIDLPLDSIPDHIWQDIFERTWKASRHLWDRKLFVISDKLRLVTTADKGNQQRYRRVRSYGSKRRNAETNAMGRKSKS